MKAQTVLILLFNIILTYQISDVKAAAPPIVLAGGFPVANGQITGLNAASSAFSGSQSFSTQKSQVAGATSGASALSAVNGFSSGPSHLDGFQDGASAFSAASGLSAAKIQMSGAQAGSSSGSSAGGILFSESESEDEEEGAFAESLADSFSFGKTASSGAHSGAFARSSEGDLYLGESHLSGSHAGASALSSTENAHKSHISGSDSDAFAYASDGDLYIGESLAGAAAHSKAESIHKSHKSGAHSGAAAHSYEDHASKSHVSGSHSGASAHSAAESTGKSHLSGSHSGASAHSSEKGMHRGKSHLSGSEAEAFADSLAEDIYFDEEHTSGSHSGAFAHSAAESLHTGKSHKSGHYSDVFEADDGFFVSETEGAESAVETFAASSEEDEVLEEVFERTGGASESFASAESGGISIGTSEEDIYETSHLAEGHEVGKTHCSVGKTKKIGVHSGANAESGAVAIVHKGKKCTAEVPKAVAIFNQHLVQEVRGCKELMRLVEIEDKITREEFAAGLFYTVSSLSADAGYKHPIRAAIVATRYISSGCGKLTPNDLISVYAESLSNFLFKKGALCCETAQKLATAFAWSLKDIAVKVVNEKYPRSKVVALPIGFASFLSSMKLFELENVLEVSRIQSSAWKSLFLIKKGAKHEHKAAGHCYSTCPNQLLKPCDKICRIRSKSVALFHQAFAREAKSCKALSEVFQVEFAVSATEFSRGAFYSSLYHLQRRGAPDAAVLADFQSRYIRDVRVLSPSLVLGVHSRSMAKYLLSEKVLTCKNAEVLGAKYAQVTREAAGRLMNLRVPRSKIVAMFFARRNFLSYCHLGDASKGLKSSFYYGNEWKCQASLGCCEQEGD